jgi:surface antigen
MSSAALIAAYQPLVSGRGRSTTTAPRHTVAVPRCAVVAIIASVLLAAGPSFGAGDATHAPIIFGYPYAGRCPGAGVADVVDQWNMYACNCTSYVAWALAANHQRIDWFIAGAMDARNWPHVARLSSLRVDRTPSPGAVAVWPSIARPFGHIAYVTHVGPAGTIDVAEYNYPSPGGGETFVFDVRTDVRAAGAMFIHVPPAGPHRAWL